MTSIKRNDEEFCRKQLDRYLRDQHPTAAMEWHPSERPDFWLSVDGQRFAVEVTQLLASYASESKDGKRVRITTQSVDESIIRFTNDVRARAKDAGILRGTYLLMFDAPFASFRREREKLLDQAVGFIERTQTIERGKEIPLCKVPIGLSIRKLGNSDDLVEWISTPDLEAWDGDQIRRLQELAGDAIEMKAKKMAHVQEKRILLLLNRYLLTLPQHYRHALTGVAAEMLQQFHEIYAVASTDGKVYKLWPN